MISPYIMYKWVKGERYYIAEVMQDLFGDWQFIRRWGKSGTNLGNSKMVVCAEYIQAIQLLASADKRRRARGYILYNNEGAYAASSK